MQPTSAAYAEIYNPSQGAIIAYLDWSPNHYISRGRTHHGTPLPPGTLHPRLQHWSDVVFLTWKHVTSAEERKNLRHIIQMCVFNSEFQKVVSYALRKEGVVSGIPPPWPGHTFRNPMDPVASSDSGPFLAMLGTPNCRSTAWLLLQHVEQLGRKKITGITVSSRRDHPDYWITDLSIDIADA